MDMDEIVINRYGIPRDYLFNNGLGQDPCEERELDVGEVVNTLMQKRLSSLPDETKFGFMMAFRHATACLSHRSEYNYNLILYLRIYRPTQDTIDNYLKDKDSLLYIALSHDQPEA